MNKTKQKRIEKIINASDEWEPVGPTPMPDISTLRGWQMRLLKTYKPFYAPSCDLCCRCTFGKCDLTGNKKGACGIDLSTQQSREFLISCCQGTAAHTAHAIHLLDYLIDKYGEDHKIDLSKEVEIEAPIMRTVMGLKPETIGDLRKGLTYVEGQLCHLVSSTHTGQEGGNLDYEAKAMHAGIMDMLGMEICDIAQISTLNMPTSNEDTALVDIGWRSADITKPVIICIGHAVAPSKEILDYMTANGLYDDIEVGGICCTAIDNTRLSDSARVIGPLSKQLSYIRTGVADLIVTDEQCIRCDVPEEAEKTGTALIATSDKVSYGLEDVTDRGSDEIVDMIVNEKRQVLILDPVKVGEVATRVAQKLAPMRKKEFIEECNVQGMAKACKRCGSCDKVCANLLPVGEAVYAAANDNLELLRGLSRACVGCGKCAQECPEGIPVLNLIQAVASTETFKMRSGRGAAHEIDIRRIGKALGIGSGSEGRLEIGSGAGRLPGVIAFVGCSNLPEADDIADMALEFAERKFLVLLTGCAAMGAAMKRDADGKNIYEKFPAEFGPSGVINIGSCVSNSHIVGVAVKVAQLFAKKPLRGNFEVIADYILHRIPAVGVAWGAYSQKATSIASGANAFGIPVILGPQGAKYRRLLLSDGEEGDYPVRDFRSDKVVEMGGPYPDHLITLVETKERAMVTIAKQCLRNNDTGPLRPLRLFHYIDLHKKYMGSLPDDIHVHVRSVSEIPLVYKREVMEVLEKKGWKPRETVPTPTWIGTYPSKASLS